MTAALALSGLTSGYGGSVVVRDVSLSIGQGEILAMVGKNGMGKTSVLKTILGLLPARAGSVAIGGVDATALAPHRRRHMAVAYAPQEQALFQDLTVRDNLRLGLVADSGFARQLDKVAAWFPILARRLQQRAGTLSGGEQKMLIIARGLMAEPRLFLIDEVTEGLQPSIVDRLADVLATVRREQQTAMLVVEQHIPFAAALADRFAVLKRGEIVDTGAVDSTMASRIEEHMRL